MSSYRQPPAFTALLFNTPAGASTDAVIVAAPGANKRLRLAALDMWTTNLPGFPPGLVAWIWFGGPVISGGGAVSGAAINGYREWPSPGLIYTVNTSITLRVQPQTASQFEGIVYYYVDTVT